MSFKLTYSRACSDLLKYNLTRENTYHFQIAQLTESVSKTPSGMLCETTVVSKTQSMPQRSSVWGF